MGNILIKKMESDSEIRGKGYVHYRSWQETYSGLVDPVYLSQTVTLEHCLAIAQKWPDNILVAKEGEQVLGFVAYGPYRDDTLPHCGEIYALYVLRDYQGQGIGSRLMEAALERLSAYRQVALWVLQGNEKAIRFYQRCGFAFDGVSQEILLGSPNTELRMLLEKP